MVQAAREIRRLEKALVAKDAELAQAHDARRAAEADRDRALAELAKARHQLLQVMGEPALAEHLFPLCRDCGYPIHVAGAPGCRTHAAAHGRG